MKSLTFCLASCYVKVGLFKEAEKYIQKILKSSKDLSIRDRALELTEKISHQGPSSEKVLPGEDKKLSLCKISISRNSLKVGETAYIEIINEKDTEKDKILITTTRPDDDSVSQPSKDLKDKILKGSVTSNVSGETLISIIDKETGKLLEKNLKIVFLPGSADPVKSRVNISGDKMIEANGDDCVTIEITLLDKFDNPVSNISPELKLSRSYERRFF